MMLIIIFQKKKVKQNFKSVISQIFLAEIIHSDPEGEEDNEEQQEGIQESPDKKIFSIAHNSIERKLSVNKSASKEESKEVDIWEMVNQEHDLNLLNKKPKE